MLVAFFSNYLTHHQIPFCKAMAGRKGVEFAFVSTVPMEQERKNSGWDFSEKYPFELRVYENEMTQRRAEQLAIECDVMIIGAAQEKYVALRMKEKQYPLTFRYGERLYKKGRWRIVTPRSFIFRYQNYLRYLGKPLYMLCASSYASTDLALLGIYLGRCYKWGYFPETRKYSSLNAVIAKKEAGSILWVGRMINWKHPEIPVLLAEQLRKEGIQFHIRMIGVGEMAGIIGTMIREKKLEEYIEMIGTVSPEQVREYMEKSFIHIATSDLNEGWGAVLNEAMNSACVVIASKHMGATGYLIKNGENGYCYDGSLQDITLKVKYALIHCEELREMQVQAYNTITREWCAEVAADRFVCLSKAILSKEIFQYELGPCSKA